MSSPKSRFATLAAALLLSSCAEQPLDPSLENDGPGAPVFARLTCRVQVSPQRLDCADVEVSTPTGVNPTLIIGGQHQYVRMANQPPVVTGDTFSAAITVQNLTPQVMGTLDGVVPRGSGVRVFFVQPPTDGVEVGNADGAAAFIGSAPQAYYEYSGALLGADGMLGAGEESGQKTWKFALNGASAFEFAVLVAAEVPDEASYAIELTRVAAGTNHSCGDGSDGNVYCWGYNSSGQLGDGTKSGRTVPGRVSAPAGVQLSNVSAGQHHSCASGSDGKVYCWGRNVTGALGDGSTTERLTPVAVSAPVGVLTRLAPRVDHTCADGSNGNVYCWGYNGSGRLGDGTQTHRAVPTVVRRPAGVTLSGVSLGTLHTCAIGSNGKVYCWGDNQVGQLGDSTTTNRWLPVLAKTPSEVTFSSVSAGHAFTCATATDGAAYCWGTNGQGQLGNGTSSAANWPQRVAAPEGVTFDAVVAGAAHACGVTTENQVYCWGANSSGQYGDGTTLSTNTPVLVNYGTGVMTGISALAESMCGLGSEGHVYCWGANDNGQLGDGTTSDRASPVRVAATR